MLGKHILEDLLIHSYSNQLTPKIHVLVIQREHLYCRSTYIHWVKISLFLNHIKFHWDLILSYNNL